MIALSAGHYPESPGACFGGVCEHELATEWIARISEILGDTPHMVAPPAKLPTKVYAINLRNVVLAMELHFNSSKSGDGKGCETLYFPGSKKGEKVAKVVHEAYSSLFSPDRGVKEGWYEMNPESGKGLYFLRKTKCPAIILEPEFIQRMDSIQLRMNSACEAIASGLKQAADLLHTEAL